MLGLGVVNVTIVLYSSENIIISSQKHLKIIELKDKNLVLGFSREDHQRDLTLMRLEPNHIKH